MGRMPKRSQHTPSSIRRTTWFEGKAARTTHALSRVACYCLVREPPEVTFSIVSKQLQLCGGYAFLSSFNAAELSIVKVHPGFNESIYARAGDEFLNGTSRVVTRNQRTGRPGDRLLMEIALKWVAVAVRNEVIQFGYTFDWYLKSDTDTLLLPDRLPLVIARFHGGRTVSGKRVPIAFGEGCTGMCGAIEVFSAAAFRRLLKFRVAVCHFSPRVYNEDLFMAGCLRKLKIRIVPGVDSQRDAMGEPLSMTCPLGNLYADRARGKRMVPWEVLRAGQACGYVLGVHALKSLEEMSTAQAALDVSSSSRKR